jgi:hypothetical protein
LENGFSSAVENNQNIHDLSDADVDPEEEYCNNQTLHAKLFVTQSKSVVWYLGSANCTSPAEGDNIEFLTSIEGEVGSLFSPDDLLRQLTEGEKNGQGLFVEYKKQESFFDERLEILEQDLRRTIYDISSLNITGRAEKNSKELFDYYINISCAKIYKRLNWKITFQPLSGRMGKMEEIIDDIPMEFQFSDYEEQRLTPYFLFTIMDDGIVLKEFVLALDISFSQERMSKIFKSIIGNWEKLMKYLSYLLSKDTVAPIFELDPKEDSLKQKGKGEKSNVFYQFPLYEKLLIAASRDVNSLGQTIRIVESLADETDEDNNPIIQEEFKNLISTFKEVLPNEY